DSARAARRDRRRRNPGGSRARLVRNGARVLLRSAAAGRLAPPAVLRPPRFRRFSARRRSRLGDRRGRPGGSPRRDGSRASRRALLWRGGVPAGGGHAPRRGAVAGGHRAAALRGRQGRCGRRPGRRAESLRLRARRRARHRGLHARVGSHRRAVALRGGGVDRGLLRAGLGGRRELASRALAGRRAGRLRRSGCRRLPAGAGPRRLESRGGRPQGQGRSRLRRGVPRDRRARRRRDRALRSFDAQPAERGARGVQRAPASPVGRRL
ncbi:MAG: hypothetical protein AVDCRST_MAG69-1277, partial [uncultured Solirubrobacteraceae bacterium]